MGTLDPLSLWGVRNGWANRLVVPQMVVVPGAGIEPARLAAGDFESPASTNFTTRARRSRDSLMTGCGRCEDSDYMLLF
jgi:hypothetical protein